MPTQSTPSESAELTQDSLVRHKHCPEWGIGKVVAEEPRFVHVFFEGRNTNRAVKLQKNKALLEPTNEQAPGLSRLGPFTKDEHGWSLDESDTPTR